MESDLIYPIYTVSVGKRNMGMIYEDLIFSYYNEEDKESAEHMYNDLVKSVKPYQYVELAKQVDSVPDMLEVIRTTEFD